MRHSPRLARLAAIGLATLIPPALGLADEPPRPSAREAGEAIRPLPPVAIPDDPPPHEGAMIDVPYVIEPPDMLVVEVLEALPGRPITGERLVRPDGTISLGFYGDVHVRGLTAKQAKVKILHHLRAHLTEDSLGLTSFRFDEPRPGPAAEARPVDPDQPRPRTPRTSRRPAREPVRAPESERAPEEPRDPPEDGRVVPVEAADSLRVFVDVTAFNSKVYYVQGDVGVPGRLPITGGETVLDALNYAGGMIPTAEPKDIHLYRPARGGKPAREYPIDLEAIRKGEATANLQVFAGDRLVVGRNALVEKTIQIDRAASPIHSVLNTVGQYAGAVRALAAARDSMPDEVRRHATIPDWVEFFWSISSKDGGAMADEKSFREALLRKLAPTPTPEPEKK